MTNKMLVTFLLDKSGSMESIRKDTIGNFNTYLDTLGDNSDGLDVDVLFTLIQFDTNSFDKNYVEQPVSTVARLDTKSYRPQGGTPLIDAAYDTIKLVDSSIYSKQPEVRKVVCILTDGEENSSRKYSLMQLQDLVKEKTEEGWAFNFMGASFDGYAGVAGKVFGVANSMMYDSKDASATQQAFYASSTNARRFGSFTEANTSFTPIQKQASKDAFVVKH